MYKYEKELIAKLREELPGRHLSLHTNGLLATRKLSTFNLYDSVTISLNSFEPGTQRRRRRRGRRRKEEEKEKAEQER